MRHETAGMDGQQDAGRQRRGASRRAVALVVVAIAVLVATTVGVRDRTGRGDGATVSFDPGSGRLSFELETFEGELLTSADLAGTPMVLNGYASWCAVCKRELPDFERVHQTVGGEVTFIGFNPQSNDTDQAQARLTRDAGVSYLTVRDPGDRLLREFNPTGGLPVTLFVDAVGVVRKVHLGLLTEQLLLDELRSTLGVEP